MRRVWTGEPTKAHHAFRLIFFGPATIISAFTGLDMGPGVERQNTSSPIIIIIVYNRRTDYRPDCYITFFVSGLLSLTGSCFAGRSIMCWHSHGRCCGAYCFRLSISKHCIPTPRDLSIQLFLTRGGDGRGCSGTVTFLLLLH